MKEQAREITGKNGQKYTMKSINAANAEQFLDFMYQVSDDTHFMTRYGDEVGKSENDIKEEGKRLQSLYNDSRQTMTSIFEGEKIIGNIAVRCVGKGRKTKQSEEKHKQFPNIILIDYNLMKPYLNYVQNKYGENFWEVLYENNG